MSAKCTDGCEGRPVVIERGQHGSKDVLPWELLNQGQESTEASLGLVGWELQGSSLKQQELRWERDVSEGGK